MSNEVKNELIIDGSEEIIDAIYARCRSFNSYLDFDNIVPEPDDISDSEGIMNWRRINWGSITNAYAIDIVDTSGEDRLYYKFKTDGMPVQAVAELAILFPECDMYLTSSEGQYQGMRFDFIDGDLMNVYELGWVEIPSEEYDRRIDRARQ